MGMTELHTTPSAGVCLACPRRCGVPRGKGFCGMPSMPQVATVCIHRGEEPPLNPIVNIFFRGCNLQCIYCQNWQISGNGDSGKLADAGKNTTLSAIADRIEQALSPAGAPQMLGFVTAAHYPDAVPLIMAEVHRRGLYPVVVYNSSGYESLDTLRRLEGLVDIYLPDLKYLDPALAAAYSHAPDYPAVATAAITEMVRQVGRGLKIGDDGLAYRGILVRHLVLPGAVDNTRRCLRWLADECGVHSLSLMAQYYPPRPGLPAPLDRTITASEYSQALQCASEAAFSDIFTQQLTAQDNYRPDFSRGSNPFEK